MIDWIFLEQLLCKSGVSGAEESVIKCVETYLQGNSSKTYRDCINNTYVMLNPDADKRIMIEAHIDEIGFQVTYIDELGFVYVRQCGGIDNSTLPGSQVIIHTSDDNLIYGVIGKRPIHIQKTDERSKVSELEELWIDTGLCRNDVLKIISVGDYVSFIPNFIRLGDHSIVSKGLDDKIGVYVVAEVIRRLSNKLLSIGVCGAFIVQEEVGCKGAKVCVNNINPQLSISVDVGISTDVPNISKKKYGDVRLGNGPIVNRNTDCDKDIVTIIRAVAKKSKINIQLNATPSSTGGTNTSSIQVSNKGVKTVLLSIPNRYMHTQVEMCDIRDVESLIDLIVETILYIDKNKLI